MSSGGTGGTSVLSRLVGGRPKFAQLLNGNMKDGARIGQLFDSLFERWEKVLVGKPRPHQETHLQGGRDPFPAPDAPTTLDPNLAVDVGDSTNYALGDHRHALDLKLTTKGDILTRDTAYTRKGVGAEGTVLVARAAQATGLSWETPSSVANVRRLSWFLGG